MKVAFFVSTGRTGTDFFTKLFNKAVHNSWSRHEPKPAFRRRGYQLYSRAPTLWDKWYFMMPRKWHHQKRSEDWYVETNYHLFAAIPLIRSTFPDALVFHIVRDGRDVVTSWLNRWRYITNTHLTPFHVPNDPAQAHWAKWNPLQKLAWYWKTVNRHAISQQPDRIIPFEELFYSNPALIFEILSHFKGIQFHEDEVRQIIGEKINHSKIKFFPKYPQWPELWKRQFWEIAGDEMQRLGYGANPYESKS